MIVVMPGAEDLVTDDDLDSARRQPKGGWQSYFMRIKKKFVLIYTGTGPEWARCEIYARDDPEWEEMHRYLRDAENDG